MRNIKGFFLLILAIVFLFSGCDADEAGSNRDDNAAAVSDSPSNTGTGTGPNSMDRFADPKFAALTPEEKADYLLSQMTLEEKVGQMIEVERALTGAGEITKYAIGSVLNSGGSVPEGNSPEAWADEIEEFQNAAADTRLGIPLILGTDGVHGHNNLYGATIFPHNIGLGAANDPELMTEIGRVTAEEMTACGVSMNFAPCLANPMDIRWGRTYEGYGRDLDLVSNLGGAYVKGLSEKAGTLGLTATAKHYVGEGYTKGGMNQGNAVFENVDASLDGLTKPYEEAIRNGAMSVMISFSSINGEKCHGNKHIITDVLKGKLGFEGFVITDYEGVSQLPGSQKEQLAAAVNAGVDMLMAPYSWKAYIPALVDLVKEGTVSQVRIDDAVRRILTVKAKLGLFENCNADRSLIDKIGSEEHREVARRAVRESLVLLRNDYDALNRLRKAEKILVAGYAADSIGMQCGGWTITWQGGAYISQEGTTFLKAIKAVDGKKITYSDSGAGAKKCDAAVVVVGELPYAEGNGDDGSVNSPNPAGLKLDPDAYGMIAAIKEENPDIPVIVILYSGRPLVVNDELRMADAFIAAWLPGTEAEGITDVLFGDYGFTGKLSYPWPADAAQLETRFEVGYGLN